VYGTNYNSKLVNHIHYFNNYSKKAIADSGCTSHFMCDTHHCENVNPAGENAITVTLPNGQRITSTHTAILKWSHLPHQARQCHIFPQLQDKMLLSIGQLCDSGMTATFTHNKLYIYKEKMLVLEGNRNKCSGMWYVDLDDYEQKLITEEQQSLLSKNMHTLEVNNVYEIKK
jgi:hypothetical protein